MDREEDIYRKSLYEQDLKDWRSLLIVSQPAGHLESFVEDLEKLTPARLRDPAVEKALIEKYEIEMAGPPLPK